MINIIIFIINYLNQDLIYMKKISSLLKSLFQIFPIIRYEYALKYA